MISEDISAASVFSRAKLSSRTAGGQTPRWQNLSCQWVGNLHCDLNHAHASTGEP